MKATSISYLPHELLIEEKERVTLIPYTDILVILCDKPYIQLKTHNQKFIIQQSLNSFCSNLPESFQQCNKSVYVNLHHVNSIRKNKTTHELTINKFTYSISKRRVIDFKARFIHFKKSQYKTTE